MTLGTEHTAVPADSSAAVNKPHPDIHINLVIVKSWPIYSKDIYEVSITLRSISG